MPNTFYEYMKSEKNNNVAYSTSEEDAASPGQHLMSTSTSLSLSGFLVQQQDPWLWPCGASPSSKLDIFQILHMI